MSGQWIPSGCPPSAKIDPAWWFIFTAHKFLVLEEGRSVSVPLIVDPASLGLSSIREKHLGTLAGVDCYFAEVSEPAALPPNRVFTDCVNSTGFSANPCLLLP